MQNTETFQTLQGLRTQPHKSPAKCTALLWIVTQFFLFMYGITAMIDAAHFTGKADNKVVKSMYLTFFLSVGVLERARITIRVQY